MYGSRNKEGTIRLKNGNPWYMPYVQYAEAKGLISETLPWNQAATRAGYMSIFANVLPDSDATKNNIPDGSIPDVPVTHPNAAAIYKLYRAGIVMGVDAQHNCKPLANIKRSEVAAILTRMTDVTARVAFDMSGGSGTVKEPLRIIQQPQPVTDKLAAAAILRVKATGGKGKLKYQWRRSETKDGVFENTTYPGNADNVLIAKVEDNLYYYHCVISDEGGSSVTSEPALVSKPFKIGDHIVIPKPSLPTIYITKQPEPFLLIEAVNTEYKLSVEAAGSKLKYQWQAKALTGDSWINIEDTNVKIGTDSSTLSLSTSLDWTYGEEY